MSGFRTLQVDVTEQPLQQIVHTVRSVEELLATKLEAQLLLDGPLNRLWTPTISMD